jgi:CRISPR-associated protein Csm2
MYSRNQEDISFPLPDKNKLERIITKDQAAEEMVETAKAIGDWLARPLSTSQIRAIYGEVLRIKPAWLVNTGKSSVKKEQAKRRLTLLRPKMAYRAKRENSDAVRNLVSVLDPAVVLIKGDDDNFRRFTEFFEAILAYHKAAGGN